MRFTVFFVLLVCLLTGAVCHADAQATLVISVSRPDAAPATLYLRPANAAPGDKKARIAIAATAATSKTALFVARVEPGTYVLDSIGADQNGVAMGDAAIAEIIPGTVNIPLAAGQTIDLGLIRQDALGGNLPLLLRKEGSSSFQLFPSALAAAGVSPVSPGAWPQPVNDLERSLFARSMNRRPAVLGLDELADGRWFAATTRGDVRLRDASGQWSYAARADGGLWTAFGWISDDEQVLVSEFNDLVLLKKGSGPSVLSRIAATGAVTYVNCDRALACAAMVNTAKGFDLLYCPDAKAGNWKSLGSGEVKNSFWAGPSHAWAMTVGGQTVIVFGKDQLWRVDPAVGTLENQVLPFRPFAPAALDGRVSNGEYYSDDAGRTWSKLDKRLRDGTPMFDGAGRAYATSIDIGMVMKPILRQSPDGKSDWTTVGQIPVSGTLLVGRHVPAMFLLATDGGLWLSNDRGAHWQPDTAFLQEAKP